MTFEILPAIGMIIGYGAIFLGAELLTRRFRIDGEYARKITHVAGGLFGLLLPIMFDGWFTVAILGLGFAIFLLYSQEYGLIGSIHGVGRETAGEVYFPLGMATLFFLCTVTGSRELYAPGLLALTLGDTAAWYVGSRFARRHVRIFGDHKSLAGSIAIGVVTMVISLLILSRFSLSEINPGLVLLSTLGGLGVAVAEACSPRGLDNLTIPLVLWGILYGFGEIALAPM